MTFVKKSETLKLFPMIKSIKTNFYFFFTILYLLLDFYIHFLFYASSTQVKTKEHITLLRVHDFSFAINEHIEQLPFTCICSESWKVLYKSACQSTTQKPIKREGFGSFVCHMTRGQHELWKDDCFPLLHFAWIYLPLNLWMLVNKYGCIQMFAHFCGKTYGTVCMYKMGFALQMRWLSLFTFDGVLPLWIG